MYLNQNVCLKTRAYSSSSKLLGNVVVVEEEVSLTGVPVWI